MNKSKCFFITILLLSLGFNAQSQKCNENNHLAIKLNSMINLDQDNRLKMQNSTSKEIDSLWSLQTSIDNKNQQDLIKLLKEYSYECIQYTNSRAFEVIVSHSNNDLRETFYLPLMYKNLKNGIGSSITYANLVDQMLVYSGKNQKYGMIVCPDGKLCPIEDIANLNKRRLEIELNTIEEECRAKGIPNPLDTSINLKLEDYSLNMLRGYYTPAAKQIQIKLREDNLTRETKLDLWYNLACCFAHLTFYEESVEALNSLVFYGYSDPYVLGDYTFKDIKESTIFNSKWNSFSESVLANFKEKNKSIKNLDAAKNLSIMFAEDQSTIGLPDQTIFSEIHKKHMVYIFQLLDNTTNYDKNNIGENSIDVIATIALHEDNLDVQKRLYSIFISMSEKNQMPWENTCTLFDKIQIKQNKKQLYGTQWYIDPVDKKSKPYPIEDIENINKRRTEKGFKFSFEDYAAFQNSY